MIERIRPMEKTIIESSNISALVIIMNEFVKNKIIGMAIIRDIRFTVTRYQHILFFPIIPPYPT
jgi:hypothetical protein